MIQLTRLNGETFFVNPDHLRFVGSCPDTILTFEDGKTLLVKESPEQVNQKLISCRQSYHAAPDRVSFIQEEPCK